MKFIIGRGPKSRLAFYVLTYGPGLWISIGGIAFLIGGHPWLAVDSLLLCVCLTIMAITTRAWYNTGYRDGLHDALDFEGYAALHRLQPEPPDPWNRPR